MPSGGALASLTGLNAYNTPTAIAIAIIREISLQGRTPSRPLYVPPAAPSPLPALPGSRPPRPSSITPCPAARALMPRDACSPSPTASALSALGTSCAPPRARRALALGACLWELPRQPASRAQRHRCHRVPRARPPALAASPLVLTVWHDEHEYLAPLPSVPRDFLYRTRYM